MATFIKPAKLKLQQQQHNMDDDAIDNADQPDVQVNPANVQGDQIQQVHQIIQKHQIDDIADITRRLENVKLIPNYLQNEEQISKIKHLEINENLFKHERDSQLKNAIELVLKEDKKGLQDLIKTLDTSSKQTLELGQLQQTQISKAEKIAEKYKSSLKTPLLIPAPKDYQLNPQRTLPREIVTVTGKFNPSQDKADFTQIWNKLTSYGNTHYFTEDDYKTALGYILEGDAYTSFESMVDDNNTLEYIIDYFAKVYGRKRSITKDKQAIDGFTRLRNEPLDICMHRSLIAIDRLQHLYSKEEWPAIRALFRKNILTQIISDDTKRHILLEEDDILEKTGLQVPIDKMIEMAKKYETLHNRIPTKEVTTAFQVASSGFSQNIDSLKTEIQHLRKTKSDTKQQITEALQDLLTNSTRLYKNDQRSQQQRESRHSSTRTDQKEARRSSFDRNRSISPNPSPTTVTYKHQDTPPPRPPSLQRNQGDRQRSPSADRNYKPPYGRPATPYQPPKIQSSSRSPSRFTDYRNRTPDRRNDQYNYSNSRDRYNNRDRYSYSRDRNQDFRSQRPRSRTPDRRRDRYYTPSPSRRTQYYNDRNRYYNDRSNTSSDRYNRPRSQSRDRPRDQQYQHRNNQYQQLPTDKFEKSFIINVNKSETENLRTPPE